MRSPLQLFRGFSGGAGSFRGSNGSSSFGGGGSSAPDFADIFGGGE